MIKITVTYILDWLIALLAVDFALCKCALPELNWKHWNTRGLPSSTHLVLAHHPHATAPASVRRLENDWEAIRVGELLHFLQGGNRSICSRDHWYTYTERIQTQQRLLGCLSTICLASIRKAEANHSRYLKSLLKWKSKLIVLETCIIRFREGHKKTTCWLCDHFGRFNLVSWANAKKLCKAKMPSK